MDRVGDDREAALGVVLQRALDEIAAVFDDDVTGLVERILEDDDIEEPGGVFEREEARALARAGPWVSAHVRERRRR